ncbi:MAG: DUF2269 family protein [Chloroflexota bacterium]|nr:DUF2269 family protein [Chloroflexota bacterium]
MIDPSTFPLWMFLHVLGAIAAFGFGFYAPIFGMASAREPQHSNWFSRASKRISNIIIVPFAILMFITGALLVQAGSSEWSDRWLSMAMLLYVIALGIVFLLQRPALNKVIALSAEPPGPEGPPAELTSNVRKMQIYGTVLLILTLVILALMVWKPAVGA